MSNYWPLAAPILGAAGALLAGPVTAIVQGIFRKPEAAANTTDQAQGTSMQLLDQNQRLAESNTQLMRSNAELDQNLSKVRQELRATAKELRATRQELRATREAMRLFLNVVERAVPALQEAAVDNMPELTHAMKLARAALNGKEEQK